MTALELIEKKKYGGRLNQEELHTLIEGYVQGRIPDYQMSAFLMAVWFQGMDEEEISLLTQEMIASGDQLDLSDIPGVKCDKHSTGGVGDKTTLVLAPLVAACGGKVAKMSGRGLGHTGGTIDKLEAIPGFQVTLSEEAFRQQVRTIGLALIAQSDTLVPADRMLYALRDVSGSVDSLPLIASSIMSKKLACGTDTILLDVKYGEGAFMRDLTQARRLAETMIHIGHRFHKDVRAIVSAMNEPLGYAIGNLLEVKEAIDTLQGKGPSDLQELCLDAGSMMLVQAKVVSDRSGGRAMLKQAIKDGSAFAAFCAMVEAQGGDVSYVRHPKRFAQAAFITPLSSPVSGYVKELHALSLGQLAMELGAGRKELGDTIDPSVGIVLTHKIGDAVEEGEPLAFIHSQKPLSEQWKKRFYASWGFSKEPFHKKADTTLILE